MRLYPHPGSRFLIIWCPILVVGLCSEGHREGSGTHPESWGWDHHIRSACFEGTYRQQDRPFTRSVVFLDHVEKYEVVSRWKMHKRAHEKLMFWHSWRSFIIRRAWVYMNTLKIVPSFPPVHIYMHPLLIEKGLHEYWLMIILFSLRGNLPDSCL